MTFFYYDTVKYVHIADVRLASLRYVCLVLIALYVVVVEMWAMGGWLESKPVRGVVRFSLQQPTKGCDPALPNCTNNFTPMDKLSYCEQNVNATYKGKVLSCEQYESTNMQIVSESSIAVITRASVVNQTLACDSDLDMSCPRTYQNVSPESKFYTAEAERFTVLLDHAVTQAKLCDAAYKSKHYSCSAESRAYQGRLYSSSTALCREQRLVNNAFSSLRGNVMTEDAPCYVGPSHTDQALDFFSVDVLLQASGISLDDCTDSTCQTTYRETGLTVLVAVYWSDFVSWQGRVEPYYYYKPQLVSGSMYKQLLPFYQNYREHRTLLNAHGVKLAILLGGEFHQFNAINFVVTLTTALGLLAVATFLVDMAMLYVLPEKRRYQEAKYENVIHQQDAGQEETTEEPDQEGPHDSEPSELNEPLLSDS